jgi:hypothetical protein
MAFAGRNVLLHKLSQLVADGLQWAAVGCGL